MFSTYIFCLTTYRPVGMLFRIRETTMASRAKAQDKESAGESGKPSAKDKLLDAAVHVVRQKGYAATSVDDLCKAAGVTKGAFFHHFESKEDARGRSGRALERIHQRIFPAGALSRAQGSARPRARLCRFPPADSARRARGFHLPARHHGAGGLRHQPENPPGLRRQHQRPMPPMSRSDIAAAKKLYAPERNLESGRPRAVHPGRRAGRFHSGQSQERPGRRPKPASCI